MADNRPWAKIDTGYILNPKWFEIERYLHDNANGKTDGTCHELAIANAVRTAREAHLASILYCAQNQTDGVFPVRAIKALVTVASDMEELAITALFEVGMWLNQAGGMAEVRDYLEHQPPASLSRKRSEAGKKGAAGRWQKHGKSHELANGKTMATANAEKRREEKNLIEDDFASWYKHYPKKVGKGDALKAFKAARKKVDLDTLVAATKKYAAAVKDAEPRFIKNPGPWLRDERWLDDLSATVPSYDPWEANRV